MSQERVKKILIFSLAYYPKHVGGAEVAVKEITDRIDPKEIEFHMVTLRFDSTLPKTETIGNVTVHRIGFTSKNPTMVDIKKFPLHLNKFLFQFLAAWKAGSLHKKYHYDGIWAMMAHSCAVPAGIFKTHHLSIPYALTLQEGDPIDHIKRTMLPLYPLFVRGFKKADVMQTISTFLARWGEEMGFKGQIHIIPNGVNTKHFSQDYTKEELDTLKQGLGKKINETWLIHTGRYVTKNGLDDIIRALPMLPENVHLFMIGDGPQEQTYKDLAESLKVSKRMHFHPYVPVDKIPKYLKACDIFIRPSLSEGMGNSFIEAMAAGIPVIATQEGGITDFLFDPDRNPDKKPTGFAVNPHDPEGIARQVKRFLEDKKLRDEIIKNARELAFAKYDWDKIAVDMQEKVFKPLLTKSK
ncbi:MAG: glycosyltransferase family 4 protein [bacterium]|nr:glycosyltransferase family 4 protein [bacterium]